jgi:hypothetical protein
MTVNQAVQKFGNQCRSAALSALYDKSATRIVSPSITRSSQRRAGAGAYADWRGKPWRSVYWDEQDGDNTR